MIDQGGIKIMENLALSFLNVTDGVFVFLTGMEPTNTNFFMFGFLILAALKLLENVARFIQIKVYESMTDEEKAEIDREEGRC